MMKLLAILGFSMLSTDGKIWEIAPDTFLHRVRDAEEKVTCYIAIAKNDVVVGVSCVKDSLQASGKSPAKSAL